MLFPVVFSLPWTVCITISEHCIQSSSQPQTAGNNSNPGPENPANVQSSHPTKRSNAKGKIQVLNLCSCCLQNPFFNYQVNSCKLIISCFSHTCLLTGHPPPSMVEMFWKNSALKSLPISREPHFKGQNQQPHQLCCAHFTAVLSVIVHGLPFIVTNLKHTCSITGPAYQHA